MKYDKNKAINIIVNAAENYKKYLQDKVFLIIYQEKGITKFCEKCINHKLSPADFEFDKGGKTEQKMVVLPFLHELLYHNCMIGNFINNGIYIKADYFCERF